MNHYGTIMKHYEPLTSIFPRLSTSNQRTPGRSLWHLEGSSCLAVCSWDSTGPPMVTSGDPNDLTQQYLGLVATGACKSFSSYCWWYIYIYIYNTHILRCHATPRHAMPSSHTILYIALHYIRLHYNYTTYTWNHMYVYLYIYIYIYLRVCVCACVYIPILLVHTPRLGSFYPQCLRYDPNSPRIAASNSMSVSLVRGSANFGSREISACTTLKQSQRHRGP